MGSYVRDPAACLKLTVVEARKLARTSFAAKDPYCVMEVVGGPNAMQFQTPVEAGVGSVPVWDHIQYLYVLSHYQLRVSGGSQLRSLSTTLFLP